MHGIGNSRVRPAKRRRVVGIAAALLGAAVLCQPDFADAAHGGGGGGGGFHGGGFGGFHGGGFHAGGFHAGGYHGRIAGVHNGFGGYHGGRWYHGWHNGRYGWWGVGPGLGWSLYYPDEWYYEDAQPTSAQTWYYCSDPAGYYPYVTQCNTGWQAVPAS